MTGYESKRAAARVKLLVTDIDGHVVRDARKPKKAALDRDAEIERLNEKIEFLARTNMLYSDWEHRETQVTSDLIRKGIEEAKINAELRAEVAELKAQLVAQPAQEPPQYSFKAYWAEDGRIGVVACIIRPDGGPHIMEEFIDPPQATEKYTYGTPLLDAMTKDHVAPPPAQEPVAYLCRLDEHGLFDIPTPDKACKDCFPVYAAPPQLAQELWRESASDYERGVIDGRQMQAQSSVDKAVNAMTQRPWVGLTDKDKTEILNTTERDERGFVMELVEAKLKDKNNAA